MTQDQAIENAGSVTTEQAQAVLDARGYLIVGSVVTLLPGEVTRVRWEHYGANVDLKPFPFTVVSETDRNDLEEQARMFGVRAEPHSQGVRYYRVVIE